jgi:hypothetical protein
MVAADYDELRALNIEIGNAEARGDRSFFDDLLAPVFAMRRADGKRMDNREQFISGVVESSNRATEIQSITLFDLNRALVVCVVMMETAEGPKQFHNLRLFTRQSADGPWKLLAWANEPTSSPEMRRY